MDSTGPSLPADQFVLHSLRRDPCVRFVRGENARMWDADGLSYLDTMSGSAGPAMVGHANPHVAEAVARQMATLPTTNILHQSDAVIAYCTRLAGLTPQGLTKIALVAGGGEAIEAAIKLAMRVTGRTEVLSLHGAYHGMSLATMGLAAAAGMAVLDVVEGERLIERARTLGARATSRFRELAERFDTIGDVRGPGLFIGVDFVLDRESKEPATEVCAEAWRFAVERGLLCQFGGIGGNVLKFKPPLTTPEKDFERMLDLVEEVTAFIEDRVHRRVATPA